MPKAWRIPAEDGSGIALVQAPPQDRYPAILEVGWALTGPAGDLALARQGADQHTARAGYSARPPVKLAEELAAAMIDRLVHHADVIAVKETATCSKTETSARVPAATTETS